jgi:hypothetical protein
MLDTISLVRLVGEYKTNKYFWEKENRSSQKPDSECFLYNINIHIQYMN